MVTHGDMIHSLSSHIIIRTINANRTQANNIYITSHIPWINDYNRYYCPCNTDSKMTMEKLIEHIKIVHMGISPYYIYESDS